MSDSLGISLSGLQLNATRAGVAANNIANSQSTGPASDPSRAYQPQQVRAVSAGEGGGVRAVVEGTQPATTPAYAPTDANADEQGMVAMPNVNLEQQVIEQMTAVTGYRANAAAIKTLAAMDKALLDIKV